MAYQFSIEPEALKRRYSVYVVVAEGDGVSKLYVGKTGDNWEGCNPIISRCGNHFSYNKIHSQVRNKLEAHEGWSYTYVFDHFDEYPEDLELRRACIDNINEMERWLNEKIQILAAATENVELLNPYKSKGHIPREEKEKRASLRTSEARIKLLEIVSSVQGVLRNDR